MNLLDFIILTPLIFALGRGIYKGLINELASLIALFLGIFIAYKYAEKLDSFILSYLEDPGQWSLIVSYALIFIAVFFGVMLLSRMLTQIAGILALGIINRLLGGVFGFLKMLVILLILIHLTYPIIAFRDLQEDSFFKESILYNKLLVYSSVVGNYIDFDKKSETYNMIPEN